MTIKISRVTTYLTAPEGINLVVVRVDTNQAGLYGLGCATFAYRALTVKSLIDDYIGPLLIGRDAQAIEEIWQLVHQNAYWRHGPIENNALSGIDMALWDIKGKLAALPLYQLFGGKVREAVPVYRHADGKSIEDLCDKISEFQEKGITHIRCQAGGYGGGRYGPAPIESPQGAPEGVYLDPRTYMRDTVAMFEKIRDKFGFEIELIHDVHERLHPVDAIKLAQALEPFDLFFLEDAIALEQGDWLRELRAKTTLPLAQGELFNHPLEWKTLISDQLIDFIRVHISQIGGITPARKLQIFAEHYGVRTAWHGPGDMSPIAHAANIHLDLAARNFGVQEWSGTEPPNIVIQEVSGPHNALLDVFPGLPELKNGFVYASEKPGLGVEFDDALALKFPCQHGITTWTQTRLRDGSLHTP